VVGQRFAQEADAPCREDRLFPGHAVPEPARRAELPDERLAGGIGVGVVDVAEFGAAPGIGLGGEGAMILIEKWPVAFHQSPWNTGFCFDAKAS
jgi:hypothetical protein